MTDARTFHDSLGATYVESGGYRIPDHYGRPAQAHRDVRNGVGVTEQPADFVVVTGDDRVAYLNNALTNTISPEPGSGCFALLLTPKGRIRLEMYVYTAEERLILVLPPGTAPNLLADWREKVFIQDVAFEDITEERTILGVHGPKATELLGHVFPSTTLPVERFSFIHARIEDRDIPVIATDAPCGETSYEIICPTDDAGRILHSLVSEEAVPFGWSTWETLTLEAGTLLFDDVIERIPNVVGLRSAIDFEKGCFVGQEVVSRLENLGEQNNRIVGLHPELVPNREASVLAAEIPTGEILRGGTSPTLEHPIALALVSSGAPDDVVVQMNGDAVDASIRSLPFVDGSERSGRLPRY